MLLDMLLKIRLLLRNKVFFRDVIKEPDDVTKRVRIKGRQFVRSTTKNNCYLFVFFFN